TYAILLGCVACVVGCSSENKVVAPLARPASETLGALHVSPLNVVMAVMDTLSIHATGQSLTGTPVDLDSVEYVLPNPSDSLRVHISPTGVVTGVVTSGNSSPVLLQVIGFKDGLARAEQSIIQVTAASFPGATLSIQPVPPDSTRLALGNTKKIVPV